MHWREALPSVIESHFESMVALRRHLHMNPEASGLEFDTSQLIYGRFLDAGFQVRQGPNGCGVLVDFVCGQPNLNEQLFAFRADIDALRIHDDKTVSYRSTRPGLMHACGHDAHTAIVSGSLMAIQTLWHRQLLDFPPRVRGVFQPAEETAEGASRMIECGAVEGVGAMIATHVDPTRPVGQLGLREGTVTASCEEMHVSVRGRGGHAARPHEARDPILAASQLISSLYLQISRWTDSQDAVVCTIGRVDAGHTANVIPERADLYGTLRTLDPSVRDRTHELIQHLADAVARGTQTEIKVKFGESTPPVNNEPALVHRLWQAANEMVGPDAGRAIPRASMGSEDFSFYGEYVPTAMFRLGCASERAGGMGLHTSTFDIDEEALRIGATVMTHTAIRWMEDRHAKDSIPTQFLTDSGR